MSSNPDSYGWGPGWPNCQTSKLVTVELTSSGIRLPIRRELGTLVSWLCHETERRGYRLVPGWCWSFACRPVRGYNVASFHSWGMAVDLNAPKNPMLYGQPGWAWLHANGRTDMPDWLPPLWKSHMFEWGGDYAHRQDAMHFGFRGTPADAARITGTLHADPSPLTLRTTLRVGSHGEVVKRVQELLLWYSAKYSNPDVNPGAVDGLFGVRTAGAVMAFKSHIYKLETAFHLPLTFHRPLDGAVGPVTLGALLYWASA